MATSSGTSARLSLSFLRQTTAESTSSSPFPSLLLSRVVLELSLTPLPPQTARGASRFDNYAAVMSVSEELLCAFELLKPLDAPALRKEMTKAKRKRCVPSLPPLGRP